jgi:hypothetical protein
LTSRALFEKEIVRKSDIVNKDRYVLKITDNLINGLTTDLFIDDLMQGSGNELDHKIKALYSSSALTVNNFAIVKKHLSDFEFLGSAGFNKANYERKFETGLSGTPPNLDIAIENNDVLIAFESKYLELLEIKKVAFKNSYNQNKLSYLDDFWFSFINQYKNKVLNLDVAQLIKHSIGLLNFKRKTSKNVVLVYIYWTPINQNKFNEYNKHWDELLEFSELLKNQNDIKFHNLTYIEFWNFYNHLPMFNNHFNKMRKRYNIRI